MTDHNATLDTIGGEMNELRALLDIAEDSWHDDRGGGGRLKCYAAIKAAIRLADGLHEKCCDFRYGEDG